MTPMSGNGKGVATTTRRFLYFISYTFRDKDDRDIFANALVNCESRLDSLEKFNSVWMGIAEEQGLEQHKVVVLHFALME